MNGVKRTIEPNRDPVIFDGLPVIGLHERAAAESHHTGIAGFYIRNPFTKDLRLNFAERGLTALGENVSDAPPLLLLDFLVQIEETPSEFVCKRTPDGTLSGSHEPDKVKPRGALQLQGHFRFAFSILTAADNKFMATRLLPLFPLSVVLLPATPLPLHIFEERYKQMMSDIMPDSAEFGVVLAKDDGIVNIGCTATVDRILQQYPDGRMDLVAVGQRRFRIVSLDEEQPYLRAEVEYFNDDEVSDVPAELRQTAITAYEKLRAIESPNVIIEPHLEAAQLSFQLAQFISDLDKRQTVLTLRSETERLQFLIDMLPGYIVQRELTALAKRVAPQNGHAKHLKGL